MRGCDTVPDHSRSFWTRFRLDCYSTLCILVWEVRKMRLLKTNSPSSGRCVKILTRFRLLRPATGARGRATHHSDSRNKSDNNHSKGLPHRSFTFSHYGPRKHPFCCSTCGCHPAVPTELHRGQC